MFEKSLYVSDSSRKLSDLFHVLQDISGEDASKWHASGDDLEKLGLMWVVVRYEMNFINKIPQGEMLHISTWALPFRHKMSQRNYMIADDTGDPVMTGAGIWVVVDRMTRSMVEPDAYPISIPEEKTEKTIIRRPAMPDKLPVLNSGVYTVQQSDLDSNGHMNNTRYFDLVDRVAGDLYAGKSVRQIRAAYLNEARLDEKIQLSWGMNDSSLYCLGEKQGMDCFQISLKYEVQ